MDANQVLVDSRAFSLRFYNTPSTNLFSARWSVERLLPVKTPENMCIAPLLFPPKLIKIKVKISEY